MRAGMPRMATGILILLSTSCAPHVQWFEPKITAVRLSPIQAVINAAEMPEGVAGIFEMVVRGTGRQDGRLYLNSELDYRDPRNLTIDIMPDVERELSSRVEAPIEKAVLNKIVAARGTAKKTKILFLTGGRPTGKYYFQTHLRLESSRDLTIERERPIG